MLGMSMLAGCLAGTAAGADDASPANLVIHASGFVHNTGQAIASLFHEGDDVFKKPRARVVATISQGKTKARIRS